MFRYHNLMAKVGMVKTSGDKPKTIDRNFGADFWTKDAMEGVRICQRIVEEKHL